MQFTTKIPVQKSTFPIDYDSKVMLLGSCFAENMGEKFDYFKFQSTTNPFGIIFNAVSLEKLIRRAVENRTFTENDIFFHNDLLTTADRLCANIEFFLFREVNCIKRKITLLIPRIKRVIVYKNRKKWL